MHKLPEKINFIRKAIYACCSKLKGEVFFHGNGVLYETFGDNNFLRNFTVEAIIPSKIETTDLYNCLKKRIKISREIESSSSLYHFVSEGYEIILRFTNGLDPRNANDALNLANNSFDLNFYDPKTGSIFNPLEESNEASLSLRCLTDNFDLKDILSFIKYSGTFNEITIDLSQLEKLKDISLSSFKDPQYTTWEEILENILLLPNPGTALRFILRTFLDGAPWLFNSFSDYMIYINVPMSENITIDSVFEDKKLSLIDVYNDFFLSGQALKETSDEVQKRLTTTLKLLFDAPNLKIPKAHISKVKIMAGGVLGRCCLGIGSGGTIYEVACGYPIEEEDCKNLSLFCAQPGDECLAEHPAFNSTNFNDIPQPTHRAWCGDTICPPSGNLDCVDQGQGQIPDCFSNFPCDCSSDPPPPADYCPGGDCFTCTPSNCAGPKCCCCDSIDVVFSVRSRCFDRVFYSCAQDGESAGGCVDNCDPPIPAERFPDECPQCREACDFALGEGSNTCADISGHGGSPPPDWWNFFGKGPCNCFDQPRQNGETIKCITCEGVKCGGNVNVTASNCNYQMSITPSSTCCGTPALVDVVFLIDDSASMGRVQNSVQNDVGQLADSFIDIGAQARFALVIFGGSDFSGQPYLKLDFTTSVEAFKTEVSQLQTQGGNEPAFEAVEFAINNLQFVGVSTLFFLIGDELVIAGGPITGLNTAGQPSLPELTELCNSLGITVISIQSQGTNTNSNQLFDPLKRQLALSTGGVDLDIEIPFGDAIDNIPIDAFGGSCDCMDFSPTPIDFCGGGIDIDGTCLDRTPNIPIKVCIDENNLDCNCNEDFVFDVCGEIVLIEPLDDSVNLVCCGELNNSLGGGCNCPTDVCPEVGCCGLCDDIDLCPPNGVFENLAAAQESLWCECFEKARAGEGGLFFVDNVLCGNDCVAAPLNCEIRVPNGFCDFNIVSKENVFDIIKTAWAECETGGEEVPPSLAEETCQPNCDRLDQVISANDCGSLRNPSVVVLNNGIGLVAYESLENNNSVIRISQFRTSVPAKILPNRSSNKGRLNHFSNWTGDPKIAKLYYYESLPSHFMNGIGEEIPTDPPPIDLITDIIVFTNGPLQNQCFPIFQSTTEGPIGSDNIGNFLLFIVGDDFSLSNSFPSTDDVYNIEWFLIDRDDAGSNSIPGDTGGLTGSVVVTSASPDIPQSDLLANVSDVDELLNLGVHSHNDQPVPVANPSIAVAYNYANANENSHFVYVVYQALEDKKWNLYLRQLRLSEYSRDVQLQLLSSEAVTLGSLNITELIYKVVCVNDDCIEFGNDFLLSRSISMEIFTLDRREVFNESYLDQTEKWSGICSGSTDVFPRKKVYAKFTHSVVANMCANQFGFNDIFYNWNTGDEFTIPFATIAANAMFLLLRKPNDTAISLGASNVTAGGVDITASQAGTVWFDDQEISNWVTMDNAALSTLTSYKGLDRTEPVPITEFEDGHCTHPVVQLNSNNDLFVVYECTDTDVQQIHLIGTAVPVSSLPLGVFVPKNPDTSLDYFLALDDFIYSQDITISTSGINQLPDMFIDTNDVVYLAWQSNRDNYWEIYYATQKNNFINKRITDFKSKSLKPSITGDGRGNIHIVWHDDRFGNWEILMAYQDGDRISPLSEQDPYMASARNKNQGYEHHIDTAPLTLENLGNDVICINSLFVTFYEDRLQQNAAFDIIQSDWPFAFEVPSVQTDRTSFGFVYPDFGDWSSTVAVGFAFPLAFETLFTSPEFDSSISSEIEKLVATIDVLNTGSVYISFRGSDIPNDTNAELQWTSWSNLLNHWPSGDAGSLVREVPYRDLKQFSVSAGVDTTVILERVYGRYKQIRINTDDGDLFALAYMSSLEIHSISGRLCLAPGETTTAYVDLTPEIRVDKEGNQVSEIPLPVAINKNQTYFISVSAFTDTGIIKFGDQKRSISCETCSRSVSTWNSTSCSIYRDLNNSDTTSIFFNARFRFYTDSSLNNLVAQFETFTEEDLKCFTVAGDTSANLVWGQAGYEVLSGISRRLTLWPLLSNVSGLLCGVTYWVESTMCKSDEDDNGCTRLDLNTPVVEKWVCKCESARWDDRFEDAPINLRQTVRWASSGDGFSDTRLTETKVGSTVNNLNPTIRMRNDLTGIVLYESNRTDFNKDIDVCSSDNDLNRIYASVFSVFPTDRMYASGSESIRSFSELLIKSDIPITACDGSDCDDSLVKIDTDPPTPNPQFPNQCASEGRNPAMALDQYSNIFTAFETRVDQTKCEEFVNERGTGITIHTCGANARNLSFDLGETSTGGGISVCTSKAILEKTAPIIEDKIMRKIIRVVRVKNDFVSYHITRNKKSAAVVEKCSIVLEVVVEPDVVAIRARNEDLPAWSTWYPFDPEIGDYTMQIPWELSVVSGVKTVTIQAATYQGLSVTFSVTIIADYKPVEHTVRFFKSTLINPPSLGDDSIPLLEDLTDELFDPNNESTEELPSLDGIPIAGLRPPSLTEAEPVSIENKVGEYIFIQFDPSPDYFNQFANDTELAENAPTFDVLQQGQDDKFALNTIYHPNSRSFRGVISIKRDNDVQHQDGLAFIIPHFERDCGDIVTKLSSSEQYSPNRFNVMANQAQITGEEVPTDVFASERDQTGRIQDKITIRPLDDPYFIFGDPNYHLKKDS